MKMRFWSALLAVGSLNAAAFAIAPEAPTRPETECRVRPVVPPRVPEFRRHLSRAPDEAFDTHDARSLSLADDFYAALGNSPSTCTN